MPGAPPPHRQNPTDPDTWEGMLRLGLEDKDRAYIFDMGDAPERGWLASSPERKTQLGFVVNTLEFLNETIGEPGNEGPYGSADTAAQEHQGMHRVLAKISILAGAVALVLAIVQLALTQTRPDWAVLTRWLEVGVVLAALVAVLIGLWARHDRQWLLRRHVAERLRMLKFRAIGQAELWCGEFEKWQEWVRSEVSEIRTLDGIEAVKQWSEAGNAEPDEPIPSQCREDAAAIRTMATYYRWKRVEFQAAYFAKQADKNLREGRPFTHWGLPLFLLSVLAVLIHFGADELAGFEFGPVEVWHFLGVWALAVAALLPVLSLSSRAWLGVFEQIRSANIFQAKEHALASLSEQIAADRDDLPATLHHIAHAEHFLEHEHREWLRLMLETESIL